VRRLLPALLLVALGAGSARADNTLTNGSFSTSIAGWSPMKDAQAIWSPGDATGAPDSGSADVTSVAAAPGAVTGLAQCVGVLAGATYDFGARIRIPAPSGVSAFVTLSFYSAAGCAGTELARTSTDSPSPGDWTLVGGKGAVAPVGAASALFLLAVQKAVAGSFADALFDDAYLNAPLQTLVIPASASIHGQNAAFFHTDVWLLNRSYARVLTVSARFRCYRSMTCPSDTRTVALAPRQSLELPDAVGAFFGAPEAAGAIELTYDASVGDLSATSRTYTPSLPSPTFGTPIPALDASQARSRAAFLGLGNNGGSLGSGFRTNAGAYNPTDGSVSATLSLAGPDGAARGTPVVLSLAAREALQVNDVFAAAGAGGVVTTDTVLVVASTAPVFPYVIVIDNQSGDSVFVPASDDTAAP
jgi:hypothetical protein